MKNSTFFKKAVGLKFYALLTCAFILSSITVVAQLGWVQVPSPNPSGSRNMVRGISGTSSSDVWALGSYEELFPYNPYNVENDLILHWNGSGWQQFPALHLSSTLDDLWDVEAISTNNVWAVGNYNDFATTRAELLHYDGTSWTNQPLPFITGGSYLYAMHALSANNIWAAGGKSGSPTRLAYVIHYDGNSWTEISVPPVGIYRNTFNDLHGIASNDIWAVGHRGEEYGDFHALAMHWNGSNWTNISLPSDIVTPLSELLSVKMVAANDVWATGYYLTGGGFNIHWDGNSWTEVTPFVGGGAFAVLSSNNIFSLGGEIAHWNGNTWTVVDPLSQLSYPSLGSTVVFSNGEIWAGGRTVDVNNNFFSLIYRSVNNTPLFSGGNTQTWNIAGNSTNNPAGNLLLTTDADVSQVLTYSVITAPAHGTLSGLPATAITSNGYAMPSNVNYTPAPGYTGADLFTIKVAAGPVSSQTTINVEVFSVVPLTLSDFNVTKQGANSVLKWTTASESNTRNFVVEHSKDGVHFMVVSTIAAKGNSNSTTAYSFIHNLPVPGLNYYRLTLVDADGHTTLFPVKYVQFDAGVLQPLVLSSNPSTKDNINVQLNITGTFQLNIYNQQGQKLLQKKITNNTAGARYLLSLPAAQPGIYVLEIVNSQQRFGIKLALQ